jgi:hypothetical protein
MSKAPLVSSAVTALHSTAIAGMYILIAVYLMLPVLNVLQRVQPAVIVVHNVYAKRACQYMG